MEKLNELVAHHGGKKEFAKVAGVSWRTVYRWVNGETVPPQKLIELLHDLIAQGEPR